MAGVKPDAHWRDSSRDIKFFLIDAKASFALILFLMHIEWWTLWVATGATVFFTVLNYFGFSIMTFFRWGRNLMSGNRKIAIPWWM